MNKKNILIALVVLLVLVLGVYFINKKPGQDSKTPTTTDSTNNQNTTQNQATTTPTSTPENGKPGAGNVTTPNLNYNQALAIYQKNGYRIQLSSCHGTPGRLSIKKGAKFMLDNRDSKAHKLVVKSQTFNISGYGFSIVTAKDVGTYNITCDGGGAAELNVEG